MKSLYEFFHPKTHWYLLWLITALACYGIYLQANTEAMRESTELLKSKIHEQNQILVEIADLQKTKQGLVERLAIVKELRIGEKPLTDLLGHLTNLDGAIALSDMNFDGRFLTLQGRFQDEHDLMVLSEDLDRLGFPSLGKERSYRIMQDGYFVLMRHYDNKSGR